MQPETPEQRAREAIDAMLAAAGWVVQDRAGMNLSAARGVAVREFPLRTGEADYLLFVDGRAAGALEAKQHRRYTLPETGEEPTLFSFPSGKQEVNDS